MFGLGREKRDRARVQRMMANATMVVLVAETSAAEQCADRGFLWPHESLELHYRLVLLAIASGLIGSTEHGVSDKAVARGLEDQCALNRNQYVHPHLQPSFDVEVFQAALKEAFDVILHRASLDESSAHAAAWVAQPIQAETGQALSHDYRHWLAQSVCKPLMYSFAMSWKQA